MEQLGSCSALTLCYNLGKDSGDTTVFIESPQQREDLEELSISCSPPIPLDDNNTSPTSQEPSISSAVTVSFAKTWLGLGFNFLIFILH